MPWKYISDDDDDENDDYNLNVSKANAITSAGTNDEVRER